MKAKYIIGLIIIAVFLAWAATSFMSTTIRYVSIDDVPRSTGTIQAMGEIDFDRVIHDADSGRLIFEITGLEEDTRDDRLKVIYYGAVPGNFDQATSVVVRGQYRDDVFMANELLVKCPSKYQGMAEGT